VNDWRTVELAMQIKEAGVDLMNIIPLIPSAKMKSHHAVTFSELKEARRTCEEIIPQFHRCEQYRADVIYLP